MKKDRFGRIETNECVSFAEAPSDRGRIIVSNIERSLVEYSANGGTEREWFNNDELVAPRQ